ncbi:MAG: nuclease-related domain-containing protein [Solirubrobacteraceae bacterium]
MPASYDPTLRTPGQHARATVRRLRMRTLVTLGVLAVPTTFLGRTFGWQNHIFMGSEVALLIAIFLISHYVLPLVDRHDRGATGEEQVGALLEGLSAAGWRVLHDTSFGHGNVDHIAIGPAGIFTIETKSHPGPVRVGRVHGATLNQAKAQQKLVARLTGEQVEPLVVYSRAWVDKPMVRRKGVRMIPARMLVGYLTGRGSRLSEEQIQLAYQTLLVALKEYSGRPPDRLSAGSCHSYHSELPRLRRPVIRGGRD